jgi:hypothetical protein
LDCKAIKRREQRVNGSRKSQEDNARTSVSFKQDPFFWSGSQYYSDLIGAAKSVAFDLEF